MSGRAGRAVILTHQIRKAPSGTIVFVLVPCRIMIVDASECPKWFGIVFVDDFVLVDRNGLKALER